MDSSCTGIKRGRKQAIIKSPSFCFLTATFAGHSLCGSSAELISNGIRSNRTCTIQISNHLAVPLTDPQYFCYDGGLYYPLPSLIQPGTREACVFSKDPDLPHGVMGVITFQIGNTSQQRIAIMFSVAYNQLQYRNHFGTAVIHVNRSEEEFYDHAMLFERMYHEQAFYEVPGRCHSLASDGVPVWTCDGQYQIRGTMSDRGKAIIKLNITPVV